MDDRTWHTILAIVFLSAMAMILDWQNPEFDVTNQFWLFLAALIGLLSIFNRNGRNGNGGNGRSGDRDRRKDDDDDDA